MIGEEDLMFKVKKLKETIPAREWRYYYLQSVENFIYHLKSFKSERTRERMANEIEKYLAIVAEKMYQTSNVHYKAKQLFPLIWKISNTYKDELSFTSRPTYLGILLLLIPLFFLLRATYNFSIAFGVCAFVFGSYVVYSYIKVKARKFY